MPKSMTVLLGGVMSTPSTPIVTTPVTTGVHASWFSRAVTWVRHEASVVKNSIMWLANKEPALAAKIQSIAPTVEALSNLVKPGLGNIEEHIVDVYSAVAKAVDDAGPAAAANGLSLTLDQALVADIQAVLPTIKQYLSPSASSSPAK